VGDRVTGAGDHEHLSEVRAGLDVAGFLEEIRADASARIAEPLRDIQDTDLGRWAEAVTRQLGSAQIEAERCRVVRRREERVLYRRL
jgi:hypothetical protein